MTTFTTGSFSYQTAVPNTLISSAYFNGTIQNSAIAAQAYTDAAISTVTSETLPLVGGILTGWLTGQSAIMTAGNEASAFVAAGQSAVGFDASGGTFSNGAIRMAQGQYISLEDTSTILMGLLNGNTLEVTSGTQVNLGLSQIGDLVILNSVSSRSAGKAAGGHRIASQRHHCLRQALRLVLETISIWLPETSFRSLSVPASHSRFQTFQVQGQPLISF